MKKTARLSKEKYGESRSLPFWSWNDKLETNELIRQIDWMDQKKMGGFFMHARSGLETPYLSDEWFDRIRECTVHADKIGLEPWAYDENGWPSGFVGGELLKDPANLENYLEYSFGAYDKDALVSYDVTKDQLIRINNDTSDTCLNVYKRTAVSTVDILDRAVVDKFINATHERYKKELGENFSKLKGFFTDEPQYCGQATTYPHLMQETYKNEYGEEILDKLGLLFVEKQGYKTFRYRYWKICQHLFLENFARPIYEWCDNNGVKLTGHYIEERDLFTQMLCNAGIMPFYEFEHMPGIDWLCKRFMSIVPIRQLGSVAVQLGKKDVLTEAYAMTGWDITPTELKAITEFQYFYGANKICQHLLPYSEVGYRKNDYPTHTSDINPWMQEALADYNEYINRLGALLRETEEFVNVAVLHPIRSAYFNFKHGDYLSTKELDDAFLEFSNSLAQMGIGFNYVDETLLKKHGFVNGNKLGCGKKEYSYLIIPKCYTMDKHTEQLIKEYYANGGKVLFAYDKPEYLEGDKHDYSYIDSNVSLEEISKAQPYSIRSFGGSVFPMYRKCGEFDCLFAINIDNYKNAECKVEVDGYLTQYDFDTDSESAVGNSFILEPYQSKVFIISKQKHSEEVVKPNTEVKMPFTDYKVKSVSDNCLVLDYAQVSYDGKKYGEEMFIPGIFNTLLQKRYEGDLFLKFTFEAQSVPSVASLMAEYKTGQVTINGHEVVLDKGFYADPKIPMGDVSKFIVQGKNEIIVKLYFFQKESVYYALFGEGVTESLKNCLVYDTYIETIRLFGDFGVYSKSRIISSRERDVVFAENFYIGPKKTVISDIIRDGYPFFAGCIRLEKTIFLDKTDVSLRFHGRMHYARVYVNGSFAGDLMFKKLLDISKFAKKGDNVIEIEMYNSARNMLGPHHDARFDEVGFTSPYSFGFASAWKDGKCIYERKSYALVKFGIFENDIKECYHV